MSAPEIQGFEVEGKVGQGGMATVWKARQISLDRPVAIKVLQAQWAHDSADVDRFQTEARAAAKLKHPAIIQVYDANFAEGQYFFVMEFIDGYTVGDWLRRKGRLTEKDALLVAECVADGLAHAWDNERIVHCDIKPDNVMIDGDGTVKVADLGLARTINVLRPNSEADDEVLGTPAYMSPEQASGQPDLDCRTDIYALGCMLYHLVTGAMPFAGEDDEVILEKHVNDTLPDAMDLVEGVSKPMCALLEKMMAKDRELRQTDWHEVISDIHRVQHGKMPVRIPPQGCSTMERSEKRTSAAGHRQADELIKRTYGKSRKSSPLPLVVLLVAAGVIAVFALSFRVMSGKTVDISPVLGLEQDAIVSAGIQPADDDAARRIYDQTLEWFRQNPSEYDEAVRRLREIVANYAETRYAGLARREIQRIAGLKRTEVERIVNSLRSRAAEYEQSGDFQSALDVFEGYDGPFTSESVQLRLDEIARIKRRVEALEAGRRAEEESRQQMVTGEWRKLCLILLERGCPPAVQVAAALAENDSIDSESRLDFYDFKTILERATDLDRAVLDSFIAERGREIDVNTRTGVRRVVIADVDFQSATVIAEHRVVVGGHIAARDVRFSLNDLTQGEYLRRAGREDDPAVALMHILNSWHYAERSELQRRLAVFPEPFSALMLQEIMRRHDEGRETAARTFLYSGMTGAGVTLDADGSYSDWARALRAARDDGRLNAVTVQLADRFEADFANTETAAEAAGVLRELRRAVVAAPQVAPAVAEEVRPPRRRGREAQRNLRADLDEHAAMNQPVLQEMVAKNPRILITDIRIMRDPDTASPVRVEVVTSGLSNIEALARLEGVEELVCAGVHPYHIWRDRPVAPLRDLSPLQGMRLSVLCVNNTAVRDLSPLAGMPLEELNASHSQVADITPLRNSPLEILLLRGTSVRDISVLRDMSLSRLDLSNTAVFDFRVLAGGSLTHFEAADSQLRDLSVLRGMPIRQLNIARTRVFDFSVLQELPLENLTLDETQIRDLAVLRGKQLNNLSVRDTSVNDISVLNNMPLRRLNLHKTLVGDFSVLAGLPLQDLDLSHSRIVELIPLSRLPLTSLNLSNTRVRDLSPLAGLELRTLNIDNVPVRDLSALAGMPLTVLSCRGTRATDFSVLAGLPIERLTIDNPRDPAVRQVLRSMRNLRVVNGAEWVR